MPQMQDDQYKEMEDKSDGIAVVDEGKMMALTIALMASGLSVWVIILYGLLV